MKNKKALHVISLVLCMVLSMGSLTALASCKKKKGNNKDAIALMTDPLSGLYNPFYATSGADMEVVGMTQIGMISTDDNGKPVAGDDQATVVKDFDKGIYNEAKNETVYTFVIKNGLKFSDGKPLTMNDVIFNMYEYLDPVYTGSSTMYSTKIKGLTEYRTQQNLSAGGSAVEENISKNAAMYARERISTLRTVYQDEGRKNTGSQTSFLADESQMRAAISQWNPTPGYMSAVATPAAQLNMTRADYQKQLQEDYDFTLKTFKEELELDYQSAQDSFDTTTAPYSEWASKLDNELFRFFLFEGNITPEYADDAANPGKKDKLKIKRFIGEEILNTITTKEAAINKVYQDTIKEKLHEVLSVWGTAGTLTTRYTADAIDVILHKEISSDSLAIPNISGIVSLGHTTDVQKVTVGNKEYTVAHEHNADGTPKNSNEYDVLQITIEEQDPKAIYSFGFSVAPAHYYSNGRTINIANNQFGVEYASSSFQSNVIQSLEHNSVPVGAGAYKATDVNNSDNPSGTGFVSNNVVYYKANHNFMFEVKTEKLQMQVTNSANALDKLANGELDFVTPQFTKANSERLSKMKGFKQLDSWQLGYGYIGINAGKVPDINIRRAIMSAMQTSLATTYYATGTCKTINWPMSMVSWAYPYEDDAKTTSKENGHDYTQWVDKTSAIAKIQKYMAAANNGAGVKAGDSQLKITFTIAGASITEHPTYAVFKQAAEILNDLGWDIEVKPDSYALTKLSTGALAVWAAAWGSSVDPDMYQVYHKNSSATSVYAWGYREIKGNPAYYSEETKIINELSDLIDDGRSKMSDEERTPIYENAMKKVLDLAVELPVYQRKTLYAYNTNTIKGLREDVNPYSSPLEKIWEIELA